MTESESERDSTARSPPAWSPAELYIVRCQRNSIVEEFDEASYAYFAPNERKLVEDLIRKAAVALDRKWVCRDGHNGQTILFHTKASANAHAEAAFVDALRVDRGWMSVEQARDEAELAAYLTARGVRFSSSDMCASFVNESNYFVDPFNATPALKNLIVSCVKVEVEPVTPSAASTASASTQ